MPDQQEPEWVDGYRRTVGADPPGYEQQPRRRRAGIGAWADAIGGLLLWGGLLLVCLALLAVVVVAVL